MLRKGKYTLYNGKEYKVVKKSDGGLELISNDKEDVLEGFEHYYDNCFVKKVMRSELGQVYSIKTFALYKGVRLSVGNLENDKILLGTGNSQIAKQLDLDRTDKYFYEKWVDIKDVQLVEEKVLADI